MKALTVNTESSKNVAFVIGDFKMKFNPVRYRETTQQHYGKRGLSWQGFMIMMQGTDEQLHFPGEEQHSSRSAADFHIQYYDMISMGDSVQDYFMVLSGLEVLTKQLQQDFPHVSTLIFQSDNAKCYQTNDLLHGIMELNNSNETTVKIKKVLHTETQDGKCSIDAHFAIAMAHVTRFVNMGHNVVTPSQLVSALNSNGGLGNTKPLLYTVDREKQLEFERRSAPERKRLNKCFRRANEVEFDEAATTITAFEYSGFEASTFNCTNSTANSSNINGENEGEPLSGSESDDEDDDDDDGAIEVYDMELAENGTAFEDEEADRNVDIDSNTMEERVGLVTGVSIVPAGEIQKRMKRWKASRKKSTNDDDDDRPRLHECLLNSRPSECFCVLCQKWFSTATAKEEHVCQAMRDPRDLLSFAVVQAERLISTGAVAIVQRVTAVSSCTRESVRYECFPAGWARRPSHGKQYGRKYIEKYADFVIKMVREGVADKSARRGQNRIREALQKQYPHAQDLPSESEIRVAITRLLVQIRNGKSLEDLTLSSQGRGRTSTIPPIIEHLCRGIVNEDPTIKPAEAVQVFGARYDAVKEQYPVLESEMPGIAKLKARISALKQKWKKNKGLETSLPST